MSIDEFSNLTKCDGTLVHYAVVEGAGAFPSVGFYDADGTPLSYIESKTQPRIVKRLITLVEDSWHEQKRVGDYAEYAKLG